MEYIDELDDVILDILKDIKEESLSDEEKQAKVKMVTPLLDKSIEYKKTEWDASINQQKVDLDAVIRKSELEKSNVISKETILKTVTVLGLEAIFFMIENDGHLIPKGCTNVKRLLKF